MTTVGGAAGSLLLPSSRRGEVDGFDLLALVPAHNLHRQHGMIESLQGQIIERFGIHPLLDHAVDPPAHHDLAGFVLVAQPRGEVGDAADSGEYKSRLKTDLA